MSVRSAGCRRDLLDLIHVVNGGGARWMSADCWMSVRSAGCLLDVGERKSRETRENIKKGE